MSSSEIRSDPAWLDADPGPLSLSVCLSNIKDSYGFRRSGVFLQETSNCFTGFRWRKNSVSIGPKPPLPG